MTDEPVSPRPLNLFAMDGYEAFLMLAWGEQPLELPGEEALYVRLRVFWERHGAPDAP